jgi:hypothetical protein
MFDEVLIETPHGGLPAKHLKEMWGKMVISIKPSEKSRSPLKMIFSLHRCPKLQVEQKSARAGSRSIIGCKFVWW